VFTITKELDKSSPLLYQVLTTNETLKIVKLNFWTPQIKAGTGTGSEVQHYTVTLTNAKIVDIKFKMANIKNPELQKFAEYEEVSFVYDSIDWTWNDGGISSSDSGKF
jgi:type VI secretion system secreted protein Hcp